MITSLIGTVLKIESSAVLLMVNGIGYRVYVVPSILAQTQTEQELMLHTYLHVREDEMSLYGFETAQERDFFELLLSAPGIGPKSALGVLSIASTDTVIRAITSGDPTLLTRVSGIGKRTAERMVVELRQRLERDYPELADQGGTVHADIVAALVGLGYPSAQAREVTRQLPDNIKSVEEGIRQALAALGAERK